MNQEHIAEVDNHLEKNTIATNEKGVAFNLCEAYRVARPILKLARALLFWKPKWQNVLDILINTMDQECTN